MADRNVGNLPVLQTPAISQQFSPVPGAAPMPGGPGNIPGSPMGRGVDIRGWGPGPCDCPKGLDEWLEWVANSLCSYNVFPLLANTNLTSSVAQLPHPVYGFLLGPDGGQQAMGTPFPADWAAEAVGHAIYRCKLTWNVTLAQDHNGLTIPQIEAKLYDLGLSILQYGTQDRYHTVCALGQASDAAPSPLVPSWGGYYFPQRKFSPFAIRPEAQGFDLKGKAPGVSGQDHYFVSASIRVYWVDIRTGQTIS